VDSKQWLNAWEYARHKAIKQDEDDEEEDSVTAGDFKTVLDHFNNAVNGKLDLVRTSEVQLRQCAADLQKCLGAKGEDARQFQEKYNAFQHSLAGMLSVSKEFTTAAAKETRSLARCASNEHEQRTRLQEQLEIFAKQHSNLERAAFNNPTSTAEQPRKPQRHVSARTAL
jgi:uncharacterized membrane protein